jgi:hypothetical protein
MNDPCVVQDEKRWEEGHDNNLVSHDKNNKNRHQGVSQSHHHVDGRINVGGGVAPPVAHPVPPNLALPPLTTEQLWTVLQQKLLNARQRLAVVQEIWKTACRERDELDVQFNQGSLSDDEYEEGRKMKAIEIQNALKAILEASNEEQLITQQLLLLRQAQNNMATTTVN